MDTLQMRHNVYHISSTKKFNLVRFEDRLLWKDGLDTDMVPNGS